jgi:endoribonuclease Dicer
MGGKIGMQTNSLEVCALCGLPDSQFFMKLCRKSCSRPEYKRNDTICVIVHDITVVGPVTASSLPVARAFASEHARMILQSGDSEKALIHICNCKEQQVDASNKEPARHEDVDDTTETGFAAAAYMEVEKFKNPLEDQVSDEDPEAKNLADV